MNPKKNKNQYHATAIISEEKKKLDTDTEGKVEVQMFF